MIRTGNLFDLSGKVAVVTGAGSGLGRAIAEGMAEAGANVVCADINEITVSETAKIVGNMGRKALALRVDVSKEEDVKKMVNATVEHFGRLDIIFNNAGIGGPATFTHETLLREWDEVIAVDLTSVFLCCKEALRVMMSQGSGKIINISSISGLKGVDIHHGPPYTAAKGGVISLTRGLAVEYGKYGINVNCIAPGFFETEISGGKAHNPERKKLIKTKTLIHGQAQPGDIKGSAIYLASRASDFVTGHILIVDDGYLA